VRFEPEPHALAVGTAFHADTRMWTCREAESVPTQMLTGAVSDAQTFFLAQPRPHA